MGKTGCRGESHSRFEGHLLSFDYVAWVPTRGLFDNNLR